MKKLFLSFLVLTALFTVLICGCNDETEALKQRIDALEERVDELEKENDRLYETIYEMGIEDGKFYTLRQAYNYHWLSQDDLESIAYYHNGGIAGNEEIMGEDYQPQPKAPEVLDKLTQLSVKKTMINDLKAANFSDPLELENISICAYYGTYNGGVAIRLIYSDGQNVALDAVYQQETVADIKYNYTEYTVFFNNIRYRFDNSIIFWRADNSDVDGGCINGTLAAQIKNDYVKTNDDGRHDFGSKDLRLTVYGEYNGTCVMFIDGPWEYATVITTETVGGVQFVYGSSQTLTAYNGGRFYSLEQAYENRLLTYDDLLDIKSKYEGGQFTVY